KAGPPEEGPAEWRKRASATTAQAETGEAKEDQQHAPRLGGNDQNPMAEEEIGVPPQLVSGEVGQIQVIARLTTNTVGRTGIEGVGSDRCPVEQVEDVAKGRRVAVGQSDTHGAVLVEGGGAADVDVVVTAQVAL